MLINIFKQFSLVYNNYIVLVLLIKFIYDIVKHLYKKYIWKNCIHYYEICKVYKGKPLHIFVIYNDSNSGIKYTDIFKNDYLGFYLDNGKFTNAKLLNCNRQVRGLKVKNLKSRIKISFHHINIGGVFVIALFYSSKNSYPKILNTPISNCNGVEQSTIVTGSKTYLFFHFFIFLIFFLLFIYNMLVSGYNKVTDIFLLESCIMFTYFIKLSGLTWKFRFYGKYINKYLKKYN